MDGEGHGQHGVAWYSAAAGTGRDSACGKGGGGGREEGKMAPLAPE